MTKLKHLDTLQSFWSENVCVCHENQVTMHKKMLNRLHALYQNPILGGKYDLDILL